MAVLLMFAYVILFYSHPPLGLAFLGLMIFIRVGGWQLKRARQARYFRGVNHIRWQRKPWHM